jgi:hypothetical protein
MEREQRSTTRVARPNRAATGDRVVISDLANDALILRLHFTVNHLSRWLSPIHDQSRLDRSVYRSQSSVRELVIRMRDEEQRVFPLMHAIATRPDPDLDAVPVRHASEAERAQERRATVLEIMAEFRRLRQSTCSLLRSLPDTAWQLAGVSRRSGSRTLRDLAEELAEHDRARLAEIDRALELSGAREGIARVSRSPAEELLSLAPTRTP